MGLCLTAFAREIREFDINTIERLGNELTRLNGHVWFILKRRIAKDMNEAKKLAPELN